MSTSDHETSIELDRRTSNSKYLKVDNEDTAVDAGSSQTREAAKADREFQDSTHQYIIYFFEDWDFNKLLLGVFLYFFQYTLYGIVWAEAMSMLQKDQVEVTISHSNCEAGESIKVLDGSYTVKSDFQCEAGDTPFQYFFLCASLMAVYTQGDFAACCKIAFGGLGCCFSKLFCCCCCCCKKESDEAPKAKCSFMTRIMALAVMSEGVMALCTGLLWAYVGAMKGSGYEALVMAIGILFVHDCDEQFYAATLPLMRAYNGPTKSEDESCCSMSAFKRKMSVVWFFMVGNLFAFLCTIFFFGFCLVIFSIVSNVGEEGMDIPCTADADCTFMSSSATCSNSVCDY